MAPMTVLPSHVTASCCSAGGLITIGGYAFGNIAISVTLTRGSDEPKQCIVQSWSSTLIRCLVPAGHQPDTYVQVHSLAGLISSTVPLYKGEAQDPGFESTAFLEHQQILASRLCCTNCMSIRCPLASTKISCVVEHGTVLFGAGCGPDKYERSDNCVLCPTNSSTYGAVSATTRAECVCNVGYYNSTVTTDDTFACNGRLLLRCAGSSLPCLMYVYLAGGRKCCFLVSCSYLSSLDSGTG